MIGPDPYSPEEMARQVKKHLLSLKEAGVEWLAAGPPPDIVSIDEADAVSPPTQWLSPAAETPVARADSPLLPVEIVPELSIEQRRRELELVAEQVSTCSRCAELLASRKQTVFGDGCLDPELCIIGEAPGAEEDSQGIPFVGPAGQLLNKILNASGFRREEVYICNILKCRPPGNRTPLVTEAANCRSYLDKQLELVRPKFICAMGACAAQNLLGTTLGIGKLRRRFHDYQGTPVLCTYHPAYLLRSPEKKIDVWEDMKMLLARMGRPIPPPRRGSGG